MDHPKPVTPAAHGKPQCTPGFEQWAAIARANSLAAAGWSFELAGTPVSQIRSQARSEALQAAAVFSARLGVSVRPPGDPHDLVVMTGHQPEFYHPGVWVKDFLLQRLANETGASAIDLVVDTDGFESVAISSPCMTPDVARCTQYLALGGQDECYAGVAVPSAAEIEQFCADTKAALESLPASGVQQHFDAFSATLEGAAADADNLAELITLARRRWEATAGTDYLELPLTRLVRTQAWLAFVVELALGANRFAAAYNAELADYRTVNKTRNAAQPFPDLAVGEGLVELPLWHIADGRRSAVRAQPLAGGGVRMLDAHGERIAELPALGADAVEALSAAGSLFAPKALALTLFTRLFVTDLMIHGTGGGRYDRVTDGVCRRYFGVEPPAFVVASMTLHLPLNADFVNHDEVAAAKERLNRLEHNPDAVLGEAEFDSSDQAERAASLAAEKVGLVKDIALPDADKKTLGTRIRQVNLELSALLEPLRQTYQLELKRLESGLAATEILADRTYPFCFWSPDEVADKAG